jgi:Zn-dependent protease
MTMRPPERFVRCWTIPVLFSWSALAPVFALSTIFTMFGVEMGLPLVVSTIFGGLGCAASLLFHELGHVRAASTVPSLRPTCVSFIWAGAATTFEGRYRTGREQMRVAIAGPCASFTFALALLAVCALPAPMQIKEPLALLAVFNIALGLLNLVPASPLDGYKLAVGALWSLTGSESRARRILRRIGIGWAMLELPAAFVLVVERPLVGSILLLAGGTLFVQARLTHRLARS